MEILKKAYLLSNFFISFIVCYLLLMIILIVYASEKTENFDYINKLMNEWSQEPILKIKTLRLDPQDIINSKDYYFSHFSIYI